jgi:solute carrier family 25 iron transporter 28/37
MKSRGRKFGTNYNNNNNNNLLSSWSALTGASAALAHDLCMTPFDTIKQRVQLGYYRNIFHCASSIFKTEGVRAFYLSLPTTMTMNLPYGMIMVSVNDGIRDYLHPGNSGIVGIQNSMIAGAVGGAVAAALTNPLDVVKTRLQTQSLEPVTHVTQTINQVKNSAKSSSLYGLEPNMSRGYATEAVSSQFLRPDPTAALRTNKLTGAVQVFFKILKEEGAIGFARGIVPRMMVHSPSVAVSWTAYESMKRLLLHYS